MAESLTGSDGEQEEDNAIVVESFEKFFGKVKAIRGTTQGDNTAPGSRDRHSLECIGAKFRE